MSIHPLGEFGPFSLSVVVTSPPWYENCYVVRHRDSGDMVIVDPGGDADRIQAHVTALGGKVQAIWLTHGHPDHLGGVHELEAALDIDTHAHTDEVPNIQRSSDLNRSFTGKQLQGPARLVTYDGEPTLYLGGEAVRVIFTPGHTSGGVCLDFGGFVLTGDTLFRQGVGRTDLPGGDEETLWASITRLLTLVQGETALLAGHGPGWTAADAQRWWKMMA